MQAAAQPFLQEAWQQAKAAGMAVGVHVLAAALIVLGTMDWRPFKPPTITGMTIEAVIVDTQALKDRQENERRAAEEAVQREQRREQRQRELEAQKQREAQEAEERERQRIEDARKKREADQRLQALRDRQERERQEQLAKQQAELDAIRKQRERAERERKIEEERLKQLATRREQDEAAKKQAVAEEAMRQQMAREEAEFRAGQLATLGESYYAAIQAQVTSNWLRPPTAQPGLRCTLSIVQIPGGEVISAAIKGRCNGDEATRRSLVAAVERTGSLPYRGFEDVFEREIDFIFRYDGD